jgi:hypothetical protein
MARTRAKSKGRNSIVGFTRLPHHVTRSKSWTQLNGWETKYLLDLMTQYNGKNNGDLSMHWEYLRERGWNSKETVNNARKALLSAGWIVVTRHGWQKVPTLYAVTLWGIDECSGKVKEETPDAKPLGFWRLGYNPRSNSKTNHRYGYRTVSAAYGTDTVP